VAQRRTLRQRLFSRLVIAEAPAERDQLDRPLVGPCLIWTGATDPRGYGRIGLGGRSDGVGFTHRVAYELVTGEPCPDVPDHLCRIPACASPAHLEDVTQTENIRRGGWGAYAEQLRSMTHCKRGHEYNPENTRITSTGSRQCRVCVRNLRRAAYDPAKERARRAR
jgi:hypothetical protein